VRTVPGPDPIMGAGGTSAAAIPKPTLARSVSPWTLSLYLPNRPRIIAFAPAPRHLYPKHFGRAGPRSGRGENAPFQGLGSKPSTVWSGRGCSSLGHARQAFFFHGNFHCKKLISPPPRNIAGLCAKPGRWLGFLNAELASSILSGLTVEFFRTFSTVFRHGINSYCFFIKWIN